jgi:hypothetical protein
MELFGAATSGWSCCCSCQDLLCQVLLSAVALLSSAVAAAKLLPPRRALVALAANLNTAGGTNVSPYPHLPPDTTGWAGEQESNAQRRIARG